MKNILSKIFMAMILVAVVVSASSCKLFGKHVHTLTAVDEVAPTCTQSGVKAYYLCDDCGKLFADAKGEQEIESPVTIAATGHAWGNWIEDTPATEDAAGTKHRKCANCSETEEGTIPKLDHAHSYEAVVTAPTCTEKGYTTHTCVCSDSYVDSYVDELGHKLGEDGITCTACGKVFYDLVSGTADTVIANPGKWYYSCTDSDLIASTPTYADGTITIAFSSMTDGNDNQLMFYPVLSEDATHFTISFAITLSASGCVSYGTDDEHITYSEELEAGTYTFTWMGVVSTSEPFRINISSTNYSEPITMKVSKVSVQEIVASNPDSEEPETPKQPL